MHASLTAFPLRYQAGQLIYSANCSGNPWRLLSGSVRLDRSTQEGRNKFANLALAGDILGSETMLLGTYGFSAVALTQCDITPWPGNDMPVSNESLISSLANAHRRAADLLSLRGGQAIERVIALIKILSNSVIEGAPPQVILPTRGNIAEMTDLRLETVSRIIKTLQRNDLLRAAHTQGVHATRSFTVNIQ